MIDAWLLLIMAIIGCAVACADNYQSGRSGVTELTPNICLGTGLFLGVAYITLDWKLYGYAIAFYMACMFGSFLLGNLRAKQRVLKQQSKGA